MAGRPDICKFEFAALITRKTRMQQALCMGIFDIGTSNRKNGLRWVKQIVPSKSRLIEVERLDRYGFMLSSAN